MAKLPNQRKLLPEDYPTEKSWIPALLAPINRFFEDVVRSLNKGLTIKENMAGDLITVVIDGVYPVDVAWTIAPPKAVIIGQCREVSGTHTVPADAISLDWEYTASGRLRVNGVPGLVGPSSTNKFNLTLVVFTG